MEKRTFIKLSSVFLTGSLFSPMTSCNQNKKSETGGSQSQKQYNWARNLEYSTENFQYPEYARDIQGLIKGSKNLKIIGTRHSFNRIADNPNTIVSLEKIKPLYILDKENLTVTVDGNVKYGDLAEYLHTNGYALHNMASLPHISVAGSCATATHGSGVKNANLSSAVVALEMINAAGDVVKASRKETPETFAGMVVGLGALGAVTKVTLKIVPTYNIRQDVYQNMPLAEIKKHFDEVMSAGYSVSLFTTYAKENINQVWVKRKVEGDIKIKLASEWFGSTIATKNLHPIEEISAENCTEQMGVAGPWHERLPHFKMNFTPSSGEELQSEFFVPYQEGASALAAVFELYEKITPHLLISEIRSIAADDLWMSPCYQQDCVAIHFTWKQDWAAVKQVLPLIEAKLAPFKARPHWAKLFTMSPSSIQSRYKKLNDFKDLMKKQDPEGKFRNEFLDKNLYGV